jgi:hypothetical protein
MTPSPPVLDFRYSFAIERLIRPTNATLPSRLSVVLEGATKDFVLYEEGDGGIGWAASDVEAVVTGRKYLLFLYDREDGEFKGNPFGRFELDGESRLKAVDDVWLKLPEVAALAGLSVDQAIAVMDAADARFYQRTAAQ